MRSCFAGPAAVRRLPKGAFGALAAAAVLCPLAGCAPEPPTSAELGNVVFDANGMPGGHKRFLLPEIKGKAKAADAEGDGHDHAGHPPHEDHAPGEGQDAVR